jgi:endonuclease YncB( thermonuclease family)
MRVSKKRTEEMQPKHLLLLAVLPMILVQCFVLVAHGSNPWENDKTVLVSTVIDGDTFYAVSGDMIRLADIDAPEQGEPGYDDARNLLTSLVYNRQVYLDIDDISKTDTYGRLVCVVYSEHNSTHLKNVNKALLAGGAAALWDHSNEFNPYLWTLYVQKTVIPEFPNAVIFFVMLLTITAIVRQMSRPRQLKE